MDAAANHRIFKFRFEDTEVQFSSNFDSGNLFTVEQLDPLTYNIIGRPDCERAVKSCLYFSVIGFPMGTRIRIRLKGMAILYYFYLAESAKDKKPDTSYQLCLRKGDGDWQRMLEGTTLEMSEDKQLVLSFSHTFWTNLTTEFSFNYPYTYERHEQYYNHVRKTFEGYAGEIVYDDQTLAVSRQGRPIRLISITNNNQPAYNKPVILVTSRVHPSESPSSYVAEGIINFMVNQQDLRSHRIRQNFVVMVVPMLNPDGVAMGNFRYDDLEQNLNRDYLKPDPTNQQELKLFRPTIFAVKNVIEQLNTRIMFYFDLHAHHSPKGCFIYGNFLEDFVRHVEAKAFCRVMALNNCDFQYFNCNFSEGQMTAKDKQDVKTKQGCGRVVVHKLANVLHSYTVECGYYRSSQPNEPTKQSNTAFTENGFIYTPTQNDQCERIYRTHNYREIGRDLMISVADMLGFNPYSRVTRSEFRDMDALRRIVSSEVFYGDQRFRRTDTNVLHKLKNINHLVRLLYHSWQFQSPLKQGYEDRRKEDSNLSRRTQTHMRYYKDVVARRNTKIVGAEEQQPQEAQTNQTKVQAQLMTIDNRQEYVSQSLERPPAKVLNYNAGVRRTMRITSTAMAQKKEVSPIKPTAVYTRSELKLNISSEKNSSELKQPKSNMFKMSSRKLTKTDPGVSTAEMEKKMERLETENEQSLLSQHKKSLNVQFRVAGPESYRRDLIVGRTLSSKAGDNSLIKCYENARRRVAAINRPDERMVFKLPKLESLVEVKARIIQECKLQYMLKAPRASGHK